MLLADLNVGFVHICPTRGGCHCFHNVGIQAYDADGPFVFVVNECPTCPVPHPSLSTGWPEPDESPTLNTRGSDD